MTNALEVEVPNDGEVLAKVPGEGISPSALLAQLMGDGHSRSNSQRAMQRCLDRGKIAFDPQLRLIPQQMAKAA